MTTTRHADLPVVPATPAPFRLPDIPERHPDDMTSVDNLHRHGAIANIVQYLGHPRNHHRQRRTLRCARPGLRGQ